MSAHALLSDLERAGVILYLDGPRLRFRAPTGALTEARRALITEHRDELIALLAAAPVPVSPIGDIADQAGASEAPPAPDAEQVPPAADEPTWPDHVAAMIDRLEAIEAGALPVAFRLRPGFTVADADRFLAGVRAEVAYGPTGLRARRGVVQLDLEDLMRVLDDPGAARCEPPRRPAIAEVPPTATPAEHLAQIGGYARLREVADAGLAHRMWDAARLWERDQGTPTAARWAGEYWRHWAIAEAEPC